MAKRQFTTSDTSPWADKYTNGSAGAKTYSGNHQIDSSDGAYYSRVSGSAGNTTANTPDLSDGTYNLPCKIINEYSNANPNWEYNFLISVSGGVAAFKYPLTINCNYSGLGSQIITGNPYASVVINSGVTINPPSWDGSKGGRIIWFARDSWDNEGTIDFSGRGFRGGQAVGGSAEGYTGEGTGGVSTQNQQTPNGNGGGGGGYSNNSPWNQGNGGAGGSNVTSGENGTATGGGNNSNGGAGQAGITTTSSDGVTSNFGGSGGSGGVISSGGNSGSGGNGGGCLDVISRRITNNGTINFNGNNGQGNVQYHSGAGGSGAAGFGIFKGQIINLGGSITALGGAHQFRNGSNAGDEDGGYGGNGGIAVYYGQTKSVSSNPSTTPILDTILNDAGGAFEFLIA
ncbi:MAG TPA: hypothetical protein VNW29_03785 [Candidatus Sulfotelmatobacter sp.]|jgi:hypothetical protein|nr:hypothetical protein [Candidatus Sulfotelmatobacter sp.]